MCWGRLTEDSSEVQLVQDPEGITVARYSEEFRCSIVTKMIPPENHHVSKIAKGQDPQKLLLCIRGENRSDEQVPERRSTEDKFYYRKPGGSI